MSQTPLEAGSEGLDYHLGWGAVTRLLRQGWSWSGHERGVAFRSLGRGPEGRLRFATVSHVTGLDLDDDGRALARLDWDRDGDIDLVQTCRSGPRLRLLQNGSAPGRRLSVWLEGRAGQRDAIGARVELRLSGAPGILVRGRRAGEGFLAQSSGWLGFGLGEYEVEGLRVRWPDGNFEVFSGCTGPGRYRLVRGSGEAQGVDQEVQPPSAESPLVPPQPTQVRELVLAEPLPMPGIPMTLADGKEAVLFGLSPGRRSRGAGRPMLVNLWATWCQPCRAELAMLAEERERLEETGLIVLALNPGDERAEGLDVLEELGWPHARASMRGDALERLDALQGALQDREQPLPMPTSLLVGPDGRLDSIFFGPIQMGQIEAGLVRMAGSDPGGRMPRAGTWHLQPEGFQLEELAGAFRRRGMLDAEQEVGRSLLELEVLGQVDTLLQLAEARARQGQWEAAEGLNRRALELDRGSVRGWQGLAVSLQQLGRSADALEAYREALRRQPASLEMRFNLALVALELGDLRLARVQATAIAGLDDQRAGELSRALLLEIERREAGDGR